MKRPDLKAELSRLKDFQLASVDRAFQRLYLDSEPTDRFLVADEVGLGKTLVARGLIARTIDHLWDKVDRIDVIYVCSNSNIARQNRNRLGLSKQDDKAPDSRITMLPLATRNLQRKPNKVNTLLLTPGTSLDLGNAAGQVRERALLQKLLERMYGLDPNLYSYLFCADANQGTLVEHLDNMDELEADDAIDWSVTEEFARRIEAPLLQSLKDLQGEIRRRTALPIELKRRRNSLIGNFRQRLASSCISLLQPDLIILDEFQRFKPLLTGEDEAGELARDLFEYERDGHKARLLLLSATPYRMYGASDDGTEEHYADFLATMEFLLQTPARSETLKSLLDQFRDGLLRAPEVGLGPLEPIAAQLANILRSVMCRTERIGAGSEASGMFREVESAEVRLLPGEVEGYKGLRQVARLLGAADPIEYWKSAPKPLSFMDTYKLRTRLDQAIEDEDEELLKALSNGEGMLLNIDAASRLETLPSASGKANWLIDRTIGAGMWRCLWLPPSMPYYPVLSPFMELPPHARTKQLLFSAWQLVPRSLAATLSHEADFWALSGLAAANTGEPLTALRERLSNRLGFEVEGTRPARMAHAALMYPGAELSRVGEPLRGSVSLESLLTEVQRVLGERVASLRLSYPEDGRADFDWYWTIPVLLDRRYDKRALLAFLQDAESLDSDDEHDQQDGVDHRSGWATHLGRMRDVATHGWQPQGPPPEDFLEVLALLAVASPANVSLRALGRIAGDDAIRTSAARVQALWTADSIRRLFNLPESTGIIGAFGGKEPFWQQCLRYSAAGCLQAVLDEFAHVAMEDESVQGKPALKRLAAVGKRMRRSMGLRRASVTAHHWKVSSRGRATHRSHQVRTRFALRFGEEKDEGNGAMRADDVRAAFNSPFWPFVLITTSIGQEGLDFHWYSHSVVHWNLPNNPVDLEQREGRVHRYKGHAIRRNVALRWGQQALQTAAADPWHTAFELASRGRQSGDSDLIPFWIYPCNEGSQVERHVPVYPLSKDAARLERLRRSLVVYRMVFGQPRQEELLEFLAHSVPVDQITEHLERCRIDLAP